jgi:hypothetical protein
VKLLLKKSRPITRAGIEIIWEEIKNKNPITIKINPPSRSFFQAMIVIIIKIKLGIRCIIKAKNHCG